MHKIDRDYIVAGKFYPEKKNELKRMIRGFLETAVEPPEATENVLAIISPHAGYEYSGQVMASAFKQIDTNKTYDNIFILASSHTAYFQGASVFYRGDYLTPIDPVHVNMDLGRRLIQEHTCFIDYPEAHTNEHSIEVLLPFLQVVLKSKFQIVPIVLGSDDVYLQVAEALKPYFNSNNLFVISTDFSHYPNYETAVKIDNETIRIIAKNSPDDLLQCLDKNKKKPARNLATPLCGWASVLTLLYMTQNRKDLEYSILEYKNSGDVPFGDTSRVVGYGALSVMQKEIKVPLIDFKLSEKDKKQLLRVALTSLAEFLQKRKFIEIDTRKFSETLKNPYGAFVSLHNGKDLRGCVGTFNPSEPLYKVVQNMAIAAAIHDTRFPKVKAEELTDISIEISVLTPMKRIKTIEEIELGRHGIYIKKGHASGTFLPQVATEMAWNREQFVGTCSRDKAFIGWNGWIDGEIYVYEAIVFREQNR